MSNTYTQISIHTVFAVQNRENIISENWSEELFKYLSGIITKEGAKSLAVGGWRDHVHIFYGLQPTLSVSDFIRVVKGNSSKWINEKNFVKGKFQWQEGYGAFSYSKDQRDKVIQYIMNQEKHHKNISFRDEYLSI